MLRLVRKSVNDCGSIVMSCYENWRRWTLCDSNDIEISVSTVSTVDLITVFEKKSVCLLTPFVHSFIFSIKSMTSTIHGGGDHTAVGREQARVPNTCIHQAADAGVSERYPDKRGA